MLYMFDMGGVVTSTFNMESLFSNLQMSRNAFMDFCQFEDKNIWSELEIGNITTKEFWDKFNAKSSEIGLEPVKNDLFRLTFHPVLNVGTVSIINRLRQYNRVVCATNTIQSHWENHLERGDYSYFDQTYASNKIGLAKPDPEFFNTILKYEGFNPNNAFFIDDKIENCNAAQALGINTYLFDNAENLENKLRNFNLI